MKPHERQVARNGSPGSAKLIVVDALAQKSLVRATMNKIALSVLFSALLLSGCVSGSPYGVKSRAPVADDQQDINETLTRVQRERNLNESRGGS